MSIVRGKDMVEIERPESLEDIDYPIYYMYSNSLDTYGESYKEITTKLELDVAYKIFKINQHDKLDTKIYGDINDVTLTLGGVTLNGVDLKDVRISRGELK